MFTFKAHNDGTNAHRILVISLSCCNYCTEKNIFYIHNTDSLIYSEKSKLKMMNAKNTIGTY